MWGPYFYSPPKAATAPFGISCCLLLSEFSSSFDPLTVLQLSMSKSPSEKAMQELEEIIESRSYEA